MMADDLAEAVPLTLLEEDRAVSALGGQSAFMSMLNMGSLSASIVLTYASLKL
jgi:hypothetical protein